VEAGRGAAVDGLDRERLGWDRERLGAVARGGLTAERCGAGRRVAAGARFEDVGLDERDGVDVERGRRLAAGFEFLPLLGFLSAVNGSAMRDMTSIAPRKPRVMTWDIEILLLGCATQRSKTNANRTRSRTRLCS